MTTDFYNLKYALGLSGGYLDGLEFERRQISEAVDTVVGYRFGALTWDVVAHYAPEIDYSLRMPRRCYGGQN